MVVIKLNIASNYSKKYISNFLCQYCFHWECSNVRRW